MLLHLHLKYMRDLSNSKQNASWLEGKAVEHRGKFDTDQWNWETEIAQKCAVEEEEHIEAAKNQKTSGRVFNQTGGMHGKDGLLI